MPVDHETVPTDAVGDDLVRTYRAGARRLELLVRTALEAGLDPNRIGTPAQLPGDATAAYRDRQLRAARLIIAELEATGRRAAPAVTEAAYRSAIVAVDRTVIRAGAGAVGLAGQFGGIHQRAVEALAANMTNSLTGAAQRAGAHLQSVFDRAGALEGAMPVGRSPLRGFPFIGRRADDPWRQVALETIGTGQVALDTRSQISRSMARRLVRDGVTDALTGYVDRSGRRWPLDRYTEMVARTTTREATTRAATNRLGEHGLDLVTISSHPHASDECDDYDGQTFSLSGDDSRYDALDVYPPFHPNCRHVLTPAAADLDDYLNELDGEAQARLEEARNVAPPRPRAPSTTPPGPRPRGRRRVEEAPPAPPDTTIPAPAGTGAPFGGRVAPMQDAHTLERLEAQRVAYAIADDPGPEAGAAEAWGKWVDKEARAANRALNVGLGDFNARYIDRKAFKELRVRERLLHGELSIGEVEDMVAADWEEREGRRLSRKQHREQDYGYNRRPTPCFSCGSLKRRPADVCAVCGDDPVPTHTGTKATRNERAMFNREYGYSPDSDAQWFD
jgi:hypothetical protein